MAALLTSVKGSLDKGAVYLTDFAEMIEKSNEEAKE